MKFLSVYDIALLLICQIRYRSFQRIHLNSSYPEGHFQLATRLKLSLGTLIDLCVGSNSEV
jgi:hypothetical protein